MSAGLDSFAYHGVPPLTAAELNAARASVGDTAAYSGMDAYAVGALSEAACKALADPGLSRQAAGSLRRALAVAAVIAELGVGVAS